MPELTIIVPTFNESGNVEELLYRIRSALIDVDWEIIFVDDDSPDGTAGVVSRLARDSHRVRLLLRLGRRGLSSACIEGMLASCAPLVAVIDADLQHDERLLRQMVEELDHDPGLDIVVGSRHVAGGGLGDWDASRAAISRLASWLGRSVLRADLRDPMSGFFMIRRTAAMPCMRAGLSGIGFKILLDLFASSPRPLRFKELPYVFGLRRHGDSKLDSSAAWQYLVMLLSHLLKGALPAKFIGFALIGALGLVVHLAALAILFRTMGLSFPHAQTMAVAIAMTANYVLNNRLTYRDMRLRGWQFLRGWISFVAICSVGAMANVALSSWLFTFIPHYWLAWATLGAAVAAVWNYAVTAVHTWGQGSVRREQQGA
ncbi:Poly-beta-1,6-N-acetyl-D-glucosamine synthase [Delftia tsuruhatensis]|uniref:glycosyltransferase family 2 protein n=1 Tax=Delftia tsuruhatensis TaxID=180282 RepID=UPI001E7650DE|nr:glycosyltransferase family 2 protein [Delftia tsuruhatensis]CAB5682313.1 Poly-beta-1,6-N-acetyl-D-glucosamine synthase [Delftia tsuruhatensis]CAC9675780.1 Poly-beta-1,6-N-acetyl-D-glucosamine synthase [Delftia tsuruhatensis]